MKERTIIQPMEAIEKDRWAVRNSVASVLNILKDFIPRACKHEAENRLFDAFFINGLELTSNTMRKEYEEWKKLQLDIFQLKP